jgi:hypothetical protein
MQTWEGVALAVKADERVMKLGIGEDVVDSGIAQLEKVGLTPGEFMSVCGEADSKKVLEEVVRDLVPGTTALAKLPRTHAVVKAFLSAMEKGKGTLAQHAIVSCVIRCSLCRTCSLFLRSLLDTSQLTCTSNECSAGVAEVAGVSPKTQSLLRKLRAEPGAAMRCSVKELDSVIAVKIDDLARALVVDRFQAESYKDFCTRERDRQLAMAEVHRMLAARAETGTGRS